MTSNSDWLSASSWPMENDDDTALRTGDISLARGGYMTNNDDNIGLASDFVQDGDVRGFSNEASFTPHQMGGSALDCPSTLLPCKLMSTHSSSFRLSKKCPRLSKLYDCTTSSNHSVGPRVPRTLVARVIQPTRGSHIQFVRRGSGFWVLTALWVTREGSIMFRHILTICASMWIGTK